MESVRCLRCRKEFLPRNKLNIYCSHECKSRISDIVCNCVACGQEFVVNHKKKYCSPECNPHIRVWDKADRVCGTCKNPYTPIRRSQKYCCLKCNPYGRKNPDKFYQSKEWKLIRAAFIKAGNDKCAICRAPVYAIDHKVRRKSGGTDNFQNLQPLCRKHHQRKSAIEGNIRYENERV